MSLKHAKLNIFAIFSFNVCMVGEVLKVASLRALRSLRRMTDKPRIRITSEPLLTHCTCGGELEVTYSQTIIPNKYSRQAKCKECHQRHFSHVPPATSNEVESTGALVCHRCQVGTQELFCNNLFNCMVCKACNKESKEHIFS